MTTLAQDLLTWTKTALPLSPRARMSTSVAVSVLVHLLLLVSAGLLVRAMPATVPALNATGATLIATLVHPPAIEPLPQQIPEELPAPVPLPPRDFPQPTHDEQAPSTPAQETPLLNTALPGVAVNPATRVIDEDLVPVGRISITTGNGRRDFGLDIAARMAVRYPDIASRPPTDVGAISALYPLKAAREGRSLKVSALLMIDRSGTVIEARVMPDDPSFSAAVISALKTARFTPAEREGKAIPYWIVMEFRFDIDGPTGPNGKRLDR